MRAGVLHCPKNRSKPKLERRPRRGPAVPINPPEAARAAAKLPRAATPPPPTQKCPRRQNIYKTALAGSPPT